MVSDRRGLAVRAGPVRACSLQIKGALRQPCPCCAPWGRLRFPQRPQVRAPLPALEEQQDAAQQRRVAPQGSQDQAALQQARLLREGVGGKRWPHQRRHAGTGLPTHPSRRGCTGASSGARSCTALEPWALGPRLGRWGKGGWWAAGGSTVDGRAGRQVCGHLPG
jgi:hypothetical protein